MRRIKLSELTAELLDSLREPVRIVNEVGTVIGIYSPQPRTVEEAEALIDISPEEHERRAREGGRPLEEILAEYHAQ